MRTPANPTHPKGDQKTGYIYLMFNPNFAQYLKIGYTYGDPDARARQLSSSTGVPGNYCLTYWWKLSRPDHYERRVFARLRQYRRTGEFFEIRRDEAIQIIEQLFDELGVTNVYSMDDKIYSDPKVYFKTVERYKNWSRKAQEYDPTTRQGRFWESKDVREILCHMERMIEKYRHLHNYDTTETIQRDQE